MEHNDNVRLRPPRHRVDRRALGWWTLQSSLFALPLPLTFGILWASIPPTRTFFMWATLISLVPGILYVAVMPAWRYRVHRWEATDEAVYAASGWLWQQWRVVPLSRVQTVDTLRGPLQQMFGLSGITVTTASSAAAVKIKGIDHKIAGDLVEYLTRTTQAVPGDAT
ncbi:MULTISPECIES: PH domain-containing protein [Streptomyces]|uniref:Membrane-flanked domain protein n=1 Tax=Streptomyces himastatinicus ATCC 53653 TaxID=457427 RepID=D9WQ59_9ACTN|nr:MULTISPECIES: PH domain-containing protein [Streptomyces]EFL26019.1 membrane-flanked domain protein [Streptomyces himastatinicus ATCC 53653]